MYNRFRSELRTRGLLKTNRYEVIIPFPTTDAKEGSVISLFCESVNLPGVNISSQAIKMFGEVREIPYERGFDPVTLTFYVDQDMLARKAFEQWIHMIFNQTSRTISYYDSYVKDITIKVINEDQSINKTPAPSKSTAGGYDPYATYVPSLLVSNQPEPTSGGSLNLTETAPYTVVLHEAYPKTISSVQLSADNKDFMRVTVTLNYKYWTSSISDTINSSSINPLTRHQDRSQVQTSTGYDTNNYIPSLLKST